MNSSPHPARHSLYLALGAVGLLPATLALLVVINWLLVTWGVTPPEILGLAVATVFVLAIAGSVICVPVGLAALGSYRRQTAPSLGRTVWTAVVLFPLAPLAWAAVVVVWGAVAG